MYTCMCSRSSRSSVTTRHTFIIRLFIINQARVARPVTRGVFEEAEGFGGLARHTCRHVGLVLYQAYFTLPRP